VKSIVLYPLRCNGCRECETACSVRRTGLNDPSRSSIRIDTTAETGGFHLPVLCFQCSDPPCLKVCPGEAIFRDNEGKVMIHYDRCIGCSMCLAACPFGAMGFDDDFGRAFKCDLCGGAPECVRVCEPKALLYLDLTEIGPLQGLSCARRFLTADRGAA
jgi:Fe-S-cluster-containing hydrogenase component 2